MSLLVSIEKYYTARYDGWWYGETYFHTMGVK
jgi:hypothetical protein